MLDSVKQRTRNYAFGRDTSVLACILMESNKVTVQRYVLELLTAVSLDEITNILEIG